MCKAVKILGKGIKKRKAAIRTWVHLEMMPNINKKGGKILTFKRPILYIGVEDERIKEKRKELTGKTFGALTILNVLGYRHETESNRRLFVKVRCECGEMKDMPFYNMERGSQKYCSNQCPAKSGFYIGQNIHNVTIIKDLGIDNTGKKGKRKVRVRCRCGKERDVLLTKLKSGDIKSCSRNCSYNLTDIVGDKFGSLLVLEELEKKKERRIFLCQCDCGNKAVKEYGKLKTGWTKYCGPKCELKRGEGNPNWNPDITQEERIRGRDYFEYEEWRRNVFKRDSYACQCCGVKHVTLAAHHKDGYNWCKERRTDVANGVTLCEECHIDFHHTYGYGNNTEQQYISWLSKKMANVI